MIHSLSKEVLELNKETFLNLVKEISTEGADINGLVEMLETSDFFTAPASTLYHDNYEGGLCQHSLDVYYNLIMLANTFMPGTYLKDALIEVALFHDISKINFYEKYFQNKKIYSPQGFKYDEGGRFDWKSIESYRVKDNENRFLAGSHGLNSYMIISRYLPLADDAIIAIVNHHCGMGEANQERDLTAILGRYPLLTLLHTADFLAAYGLHLPQENAITATHE